MSTENNSSQSEKEKDKSITVPRDIRPDDDMQDNPPPAGSINIADEDYAVAGRGVLPGSQSEQALNEYKPQAEDQLRTGSGGDAARPGKEGIEGNPIPRRESV